MRKIMILITLCILIMGCTTMKAEYNSTSKDFKIEYSYSAFQTKQIKAVRTADGSIMVDTGSGSQPLIDAITAADKALQLAAKAAASGGM